MILQAIKLIGMTVDAEFIDIENNLFRGIENCKL